MKTLHIMPPLMNKMVLVKIPVNGEIKEVYYDGYLKVNLDNYKRYVERHEQDNAFVVCGREGRGKTTLAIQICKYYDNTFDETRIFTDPEKLIEALRNAKPFQAFLYDEAQGFTSRAAITYFNKRMVYILSMLRIKRLYLGFCIPSFFELERYGAMHRTEFLIEVRTHKGKWGFFRFWSWKQKKDLYVDGKKNYNYEAVKPYFSGRFTSAFLVNKEIYNNNKLESVNKSLEGINKQPQIPLRILNAVKQRDILINYLNKFYTHETISDILKEHNAPLSQTTIEHINEIELKKFKLKNHFKIPEDGNI